MLSICRASERADFGFVISNIHNLYDFPPFFPYVQQMAQRDSAQHSFLVSNRTDGSRFDCWKDRLSRG